MSADGFGTTWSITVITFDGVSKAFPDGTIAVDNLNLELPTGKITVFVGPSGCGKTTSLRMINRMVEPTGGRILIDGDDVTTQDAALLRRSIGYVIQHAGLFPHRTVVENVMTVPNLIGMDKKKSRNTAMELLARVGLAESMADKYPVQLSGGQEQRVGVARALAADPPVMLMDEPFSAVDPIVRGGLQAEFLRLQGELGKTIAFVTHDIDEAIKLGDMVAIFREGGHLAQYAAPKELLENPANEFVADFVGRDRGFRSLSFDTAASLVLEPVDSVRGGDTILVTDGEGHPIGWVGPGIAPENRPAAVAGTFTVDDSLRLVTDLAISSPVGIALRVDASGAVDGILRHHSLVSQLDNRRRDRVEAAS
jgi:osmoprotectant transport system ATP-binding protein